MPWVVATQASKNPAPSNFNLDYNFVPSFIHSFIQKMNKVLDAKEKIPVWAKSTLLAWQRDARMGASCWHLHANSVFERIQTCLQTPAWFGAFFVTTWFWSDRLGIEYKKVATITMRTPKAFLCCRKTVGQVLPPENPSCLAAIPGWFWLRWCLVCPVGWCLDLPCLGGQPWSVRFQVPPSRLSTFCSPI